MGLLDDQVAIITGAGRGLGRAAALLFASEGAKVLVADCGAEPDGTGSDDGPARAVVEEISGRGGQAAACHADLSSASGADALIAAALELGRVDILVNSAGIRQDEELLKADEAVWDRVVAAHLKSTFLCTRAAAEQMVAQGGGRIVNTTGVEALRGRSGHASGAAAKAGVWGLTRACAIELQRYRITVNAIAPVAHTRTTAELSEMAGNERALAPEQVAPSVLFLASELCGERTGELLAIAGQRLYRLALVESAGMYKEGEAPWTAAEIAEHWGAISKQR